MREHDVLERTLEYMSSTTMAILDIQHVRAAASKDVPKLHVCIQQIQQVTQPWRTLQLRSFRGAYGPEGETWLW